MEYNIKEKNKNLVESNLKLLEEYKSSNDEKRKKELRDKLVLQNKYLIYSVLKKYRFNEGQIDDFVQTGYLSLLTAIEKFDISKGKNFATYATYWIKRDFNIDSDLYSSDLYYPEPMRIKIGQYRRLYNQGKTDDEIKEELGFNIETLNYCKLAYNGMVSLDSTPTITNNEVDSVSLYELIEDETEESFVLEIERTIRNKEIKDLILSFKETDQKIIYYRFLLEKPKTLEEVGEILGCTYENVRLKQERIKRMIKKRFKEL